MAEQLELTVVQDGKRTPLLVELPDHLAKRLGRLEPTARAELRARLPMLVHQLYESMSSVRSLTDDELASRLVAARADLARYESERARRTGILSMRPASAV